ncbi:unnamed protein product [Lota lota]
MCCSGCRSSKVGYYTASLSPAQLDTPQQDTQDPTPPSTCPLGLALKPYLSDRNLGVPPSRNGLVAPLSELYPQPWPPHLASSPVPLQSANSPPPGMPVTTHGPLLPAAGPFSVPSAAWGSDWMRAVKPCDPSGWAAMGVIERRENGGRPLIQSLVGGYDHRPALAFGLSRQGLKRS